MISSNAFIHLLNRQSGQLLNILLCARRMLIVLEICSDFSDFFWLNTVLKMRLFIKWRFYFILFEVVTVSNQIGSIRASRYPGTCSRDCLRPPTHLPPRHLEGHLAPGAWAVTKECRPHCPAACLSHGEGCVLRADAAGEGALHAHFAPTLTWPQTQLSCFAHKPRTMGSLDSAIRFASVKCYSFHARGLAKHNLPFVSTCDFHPERGQRGCGRVVIVGASGAVWSLRF